jgi:hypothetical protein
MFEWIRDKGIAQSDSGKGGTLWTRGAIVGKLPEYGQEPRVVIIIIPYDDVFNCCIR